MFARQVLMLFVGVLVDVFRPLEQAEVDAAVGAVFNEAGHVGE